MEILKLKESTLTNRKSLEQFILLNQKKFNYEIPDLEQKQRYCIEVNDDETKIIYGAIETIENNAIINVRCFFDNSHAYDFSKALSNYELVEKAYERIGITVDGHAIIKDIIDYAFDNCDDGEYEFNEEGLSEIDKNDPVKYTIMIKHDKGNYSIVLNRIDWEGNNLLDRNILIYIENGAVALADKNCFSLSLGFIFCTKKEPLHN